MAYLRDHVALREPRRAAAGAGVGHGADSGARARARSALGQRHAVAVGACRVPQTAGGARTRGGRSSCWRPWSFITVARPDHRWRLGAAAPPTLWRWRNEVPITPPAARTAGLQSRIAVPSCCISASTAGSAFEDRVASCHAVRPVVGAIHARGARAGERVEFHPSLRRRLGERGSSRRARIRWHRPGARRFWLTPSEGLNSAGEIAPPRNAPARGRRCNRGSEYIESQARAASESDPVSAARSRPRCNRSR